MNPIVQQFKDIQPRLHKDEVWKNVDYTDTLGEDLALPGTADACAEVSPHCCNIPGFEADRMVIENGCCRSPRRTDSQGVLTLGLREALRDFPQLVLPRFGTAARADNPYLQFNNSHYTDGLFIHVPDGVEVAKPLQLQSVVHAGRGLFLQIHNIVVVGKGSRVTLIHCDDTYDNAPSFSNNVTEIHAAEGAAVEYYKLQNLHNAAGLLNHTYAAIDEGASFRSVAVTLNGGHIRNHTEVALRGPRCDVQAHGLYLIDQDQQADNYIFVDHASPGCRSRELFKGILDDSARGTFNGHVLVREGAVKTEAYQSNKNILLTDKAHVETKPFLEIYNDDVKCSHGSTIGQLDEQALFYIRSRGISERTAKTLLLYAFCDEVLHEIALDPLRERLSDLVKKRLHGEQTLCAECALRCSTPCNGPEAAFYIDPAKL